MSRNSNIRKVYFRVDGNPELGLGHLVRCIAFGQALKDHFVIIFVCKDIPDKIASDVIFNDFKLIQIKEESIFLNQLLKDDLVILDGYGFDWDYQIKIKMLGCKLVCLDDLHNRLFAADLIINVAPGVSPKDYKGADGVRFALGPDYALLRSTFLKSPVREPINNLESVFICFGGADLRNLTESTLRVVLDIPSFKRIVVVTGASFNVMSSFQNILNSKVEYFNALNEHEIHNLMCQSDVAIVPSSGILFEALATECKVISGYCVDNQIDIYNGFLNAGAIVGANRFAECDLRKAVARIPDHVFSNIVDRRSSNRLLKEIENVCSSIS
jgi:UDP-2,4-diacetamido-2,4,6-trideoxy-beta-L-altropyranose hydrolase